MPSFATFSPTTFLTADGQGHMRWSGAEYGSPLAVSAKGPTAASPEAVGPTQASWVTRGGSPLVASATAWSAVGGTAPDRAGVNLSGAETSVGEFGGSFAPAAGGAVEIGAQWPGPVALRVAGPGMSPRSAAGWTA